ncbi:DUF475 domain-containing protein [Francisellaceae bacterium]|nr:DUF475 domain-containing protein [Francisellaceae bacterium]
MQNLKYFYGSFAVTIIGVALAMMLGENMWMALYLVIVLALLEISLSFDNAVVNAKVLAGMPRFWQRMFIWIGLPIAVFGMRLVFPIFLVDVTTPMNFTEVIHVALNNPEAYHHALMEGFPMISAFGGSFLLMVFLRFFFIDPPEVKWLVWLEDTKWVWKLRELNGVHIFIALIIGAFLTYHAQQVLGLGYQVGLAFMVGVLVHECLHTLNHFMGQAGASSGKLVRNGLMGFIYLEILDASFSFDGVIGAFAISTDIVLIMIGLGIGAMYVRSLTIYFVEQKTLSKFQFLEHGAHYAIGFLAVVMFFKITTHVPEWLTGGVGIGLIIVAFIHSVIVNKRDLDL